MKCLHNRQYGALRVAIALAVAALVSLAPNESRAADDADAVLRVAGVDVGLPIAPDDQAAADDSASVASLLFADSAFAAPEALPVAATGAPVAASAPASTGRLAGTLFLGAGLVVLCGWFLQRRKGNLVTGAIRHVQSYKLGARQQVSLVQVDGRRLLLGVTADGVVLLGDMTDGGPLPVELKPSAPDSPQRRNERSAATVELTPRPLRPVATVGNERTQAQAEPVQAQAERVQVQAEPVAEPASRPPLVEDDDVAQQWFSDGDAGRLPMAETTSPHAFSAMSVEDTPAAADGSWSEAFADAMRAATASAEPSAPTASASTRTANVNTGAAHISQEETRAAEPMTSYPPPRRFARTSGSPTPTAATPASSSPLGASITPPTRATSALRTSVRGASEGDRSRERDGVLARLESLRSRGATR